MSQAHLRKVLGETLRECRIFLLQEGRSFNPLYQKVMDAESFIADDSLWNGPTGTSNED